LAAIKEVVDKASQQAMAAPQAHNVALTKKRPPDISDILDGNERLFNGLEGVILSQSLFPRRREI
jgi:hypothetical protein